MIQQRAQNDQLTVILQNALNFDQNSRKKAEEEIKNLMKQNFGHFLMELSKKLSFESEKKEVRQISATIIKNMVNSKEYTEKWFQLQEYLKKIIKDNILSTLASQDIDIRKAAALSLAGICKIEIPRGQWLNLFDILINTSQNENLYIQLSSLTTLEYIYEEIKQGNIPNETVANLLNTYYSLLMKDNSDPQLYLATLNSVNKFLPFINDFTNDSNSKIQFYDLIEKYVLNSNEKIREAALKIFIDISKIYYDSLQDYIDKIFNFTKKIIENDIETNKILCIYLWFTIGNEEDYRMNVINEVRKPTYCFIQKYYQALGEICLKYIVTDCYDNDEYTLSKACFELLCIMSRCCQFNFIQDMIKYIADNINNTVEKLKYSALNVFCAIIFTIHKESFYSIVKDSLVTVSEILLQNIYPLHFKKLCAFIMKNITQEFANELINDHIYFDKMIELFLNLIKISSPEVLFIIIQSLNNLCKKVNWTENDKSNILSKNMKKLCELLLTLSSNINLLKPDNNIICAIFFLLGTLGERSALDVKNDMIDLFKLLSNMFQTTLNSQNIPDILIRNSYQEYLSSCLCGFLTTGKGDMQSAANLLHNIIKSFKVRNDLYDEGMTLIGSIALYTRNNFSTVMEFVSPYLINGLRSIDSPSLCKASILCLSDIINALGNTNKYINDFLPLIMNILSNEQIDRNLKPLCFNIISDLYIWCPNEAFKSFNNIMKILGSAIQATQIKFDENSEKENCIHFIDLREHILETLTCIFSAVKDLDKIKEFIPYVECIVNYINFIANDYANSINIMRDGLLLLADFCCSYNSDIKTTLNIDTIKIMIQKIENDKIESKIEGTIEGVNWAKQIINDIYIKYKY